MRRIILLIILICENVVGLQKRIDLVELCAQEMLHECSISGINQTPSTGALVIANQSVPQLRSIIISDSLMRLLPSEVFKLAPELHTLTMFNCGVYRLSDVDFRGANKLGKLALQNNRISQLSYGTFRYATQLRTLQLSHNNIHTIQKDAFRNLTALQHLGLQGNGLTLLMDGTFAALRNLEQLDLSHNDLERLDATLFAGNPKLHTLLLNDNHFTRFEPYALAELPHLRLLELSNSPVEELQLQSVDTLLARACGLRRLGIAGSIVRLCASNNELTQVHIGDKSGLLELDLRSNLLETTAFLDGMQQLQRLDLSKNKLQQLHNDNEAPLASLRQLNLAANQLQQLTAAHMLAFPHLTLLDISFNHLLRITTTLFEPLPDLAQLYIEGNRLHEFDYVAFLHKHGQLQELGLCDNDWEFHYMRKMVNYLSEQGVQLPARYARPPAAGNGSVSSAMQRPYTTPPLAYHRLYGVGGGSAPGTHPYWTPRDIVAAATLLLVFVILLLQLCRILREEGVLQRCWRRTAAAMNPRRTRLERLNEEDSVV